MRRLLGASGVSITGLKALVVLVSAIVLCDTIFYSAITPLLPTYADDHGIWKTGAGILEATYAAGTLVGAIPAGILAARVGVRRDGAARARAAGDLELRLRDRGLDPRPRRRAVHAGRRRRVLVGGCARVARRPVARVAARRAHRHRDGRRDRRGAAGPCLRRAGGGDRHGAGVLARRGARRGAWRRRRCAFPRPERSGGRRPRSLGRAARDPRVAGGMALTALPGVVFAAIGVLGPLRLDELGAGSLAIGATFIAASTCEAISSPIVGRVSDRLGRLVPIRAGLLCATPLLLLIPHPQTAWIVAALIVLAAPAIGASWAPAMALLADGIEARGVSVAIGLLARERRVGHRPRARRRGRRRARRRAGDVTAFAILAGLCLGVAGILLRMRSRETAEALREGRRLVSDIAAFAPLRTVTATRYVTPLREGGSLPALVEADDDGLYVLKFRGAGQGPKALVAELVGGEIARALGPARARDRPHRARSRAGARRARPGDPGSHPRQRGPERRRWTSCPARCRSTPGAGDRRPTRRSRRTSCGSTRCVTNVDRTPRNPNLLRLARAHLAHRPRRGAVPPARRAGPGCRTRAARSPPIADHVLLPYAGSIAEADARLAPRLGAAAIAVDRRARCRRSGWRERAARPTSTTSAAGWPTPRTFPEEADAARA